MAATKAAIKTKTVTKQQEAIKINKTPAVIARQ